MESKEYNWHVLFVKTNHEKKVMENNNNLHINSFLPMTKCLRFWSDRKIILDRPMFPGYLFVYVNNTEFYSVLKSPSVIDYVRFEGRPAILSEIQIDTIRKLEQEQLEYLIEKKKLCNDMLVKVIAGPLKGIIGRISTLNRSSYILIDIQEFRQSIRIKIDKEMVVSCS